MQAAAREGQRLCAACAERHGVFETGSVRLVSDEQLKDLTSLWADVVAVYGSATALPPQLVGLEHKVCRCPRTNRLPRPPLRGRAPATRTRRRTSALPSRRRWASSC